MPLYTEMWGPVGRPLPPPLLLLLLLLPLALLVTLVLLGVWGLAARPPWPMGWHSQGAQVADEQAGAGRKEAEGKCLTN